MAELLRPENTQTVWTPYGALPLSSATNGEINPKELMAFPLSVFLNEEQGVTVPTLVDRIEIAALSNNSTKIGIYLVLPSGKTKLVAYNINEGNGLNGFNIAVSLTELSGNLLELVPTMNILVAFLNPFTGFKWEQYVGENSAQKTYKHATGTFTEFPEEFPAFTTSEKAGPPVVIFRGPVPKKSNKPLLGESQKQLPSLATRWPMGSVGSLLAQVSGFRLAERAYQVGKPTYALAGMNTNDIGFSARGLVNAGVRGYFQASPERGINSETEEAAPGRASVIRGNFDGVTIEGLTKPELNGVAFWLFNSNQYRVVIKGKTIEFSGFFTSGGTKTVVATNVLGTGYPQLIHCIHDMKRGKTMKIFVDGVEKASLSLGSELTPPTESKIAVTGTTNGTTTVTGLSVNTLPLGIGWPVEGETIAGSTTLAEILSASSVKLSTAATGSKAGAALTFYVPESLLVPEGTATTEANGQDIATYATVLSKARIEEHLAAFRQLRADPAHVLI